MQPNLKARAEPQPVLPLKQDRLCSILAKPKNEERRRKRCSEKKTMNQEL
jgi:hypothetical protein